MEIVKPSVELWRQDDVKAHVARCARVCYASNKTTDNEAMYQRLINAGHMSMLRHESVYYIVPYLPHREESISGWSTCPYVEYFVTKDYIYIATNRQFALENQDNGWDYWNEWEVDALEFDNTEIGHELMRYTFKVVTQISTSRELNRVSPNNISEQSTRYVNLSKKGGAICQPYWLEQSDIEDWINGNNNATAIYYLNQCQLGFDCYNELISIGMKPQDARGVLPLDTATVCIYTYSVRQWKHIIDLRYHGTTGAPHPNAKIIAGMIKEELEDLGYEILNIKTNN